MGIFGTIPKPKSVEAMPDEAPGSRKEPEKEPEPEPTPDLLGRKGYKGGAELEKLMVKQLPDRSPLGKGWNKQQKHRWVREGILSDTGKYLTRKEREGKIRSFEKTKQGLSAWKSNERKELDARIAVLKATKGSKAA